MRIPSVRGRLFALLAATSIIAVTSPARAYSVADSYWGGVNTYNPTNGDVISNDAGTNFNMSAFQIFDINASRSGNNLTVTVDTNYTNHVGIDGTGLGALFIGTSAPTWNGTNSSGFHEGDTFVANTARFNYAVQINQGTNGQPGVNSGTASVWALNGTGSDVQKSWVVGPSHTTNGYNGWLFRQDQAVGVLTAGKTALQQSTANWVLSQGTDGTVGQGGGQLTFTISNLFNLAGVGTSIWLEWAMTCGNDVILEQVNLPGEINPPAVPLPAALPMFVGGLGVLGLLARRRRAAKAG